MRISSLSPCFGRRYNAISKHWKKWARVYAVLPAKRWNIHNFMSYSAEVL